MGLNGARANYYWFDQGEPPPPEYRTLTIIGAGRSLLPFALLWRTLAAIILATSFA